MTTGLRVTALRRSIGYAETLVHQRARGGVLQVHFLARFNEGLGGKGRQCRLVEAAENEFLLARVVADIADGEDAGNVGLKSLGIDGDGLLVQCQAPLGDRPQLGREAEEDQDVICLNQPVAPVLQADFQARQAIAIAPEGCGGR